MQDGSAGRIAISRPVLRLHNLRKRRSAPNRMDRTGWRDNACGRAAPKGIRGRPHLSPTSHPHTLAHIQAGERTDPVGVSKRSEIAPSALQLRRFWPFSSLVFSAEQNVRVLSCPPLFCPLETSD